MFVNMLVSTTMIVGGWKEDNMKQFLSGWIESGLIEGRLLRFLYDIMYCNAIMVISFCLVNTTLAD